MGEFEKKKVREIKRKNRVRKKIIGTSTRPRLTVFRSHKHIYAQMIDDFKGHTLISVSSLDKELKLKYGGNIEAAKRVGTLLGGRASKKKIKNVIFDRGQYLYHGRIKALADSVREQKINF